MSVYTDPEIKEGMTIEEVRGRCHHYLGKGLVIGVALMFAVGFGLFLTFEFILKR